MPGQAARREIVSIEGLARQTPGFFADLENLVNEAAILAAQEPQDGRPE